MKVRDGSNAHTGLGPGWGYIQMVVFLHPSEQMNNDSPSPEFRIWMPLHACLGCMLIISVMTVLTVVKVYHFI